MYDIDITILELSPCIQWYFLALVLWLVRSRVHNKGEESIELRYR